MQHTAEAVITTDLNTGEQTAELIDPELVQAVAAAFQDTPARAKKIEGRNAIIEVDRRGLPTLKPLRKSGAHKIQRPKPLTPGKRSGKAAANPPMPRLRGVGRLGMKGRK